VPPYDALITGIVAVGTPREYLQHYVFPILLPALEDLLQEAKAHRCFEVIIVAIGIMD